MSLNSTGIGGSLMPTGAVLPYPIAVAPDEGWLLCDGTAVGRATYAALFALISTSYGAGDGSTTFNVPDLRGRAPVALDNLGGSDAGRLSVSNTLGGSGGGETHTLTTSEMPTHSHSVSDPTHLHNIIWSSADVDSPFPRAGGASNAAGFTYFNTAGISINNAGSGSAHNNMQPYILMSYIIKT